jgi:hypothetical protein
MKKLASMREALDDDNLLGLALPGETWRAWRVLLIAMMGEKLGRRERQTFQRLTGRNREPGRQVEEFWGAVGRRGGKTRAMSTLACYLGALVDHSAVLTSGERGVIPFLAASTRQAQIAHGYAAGILANAPMLAGLVTSATADTLSLTTRVDLEIRPASFRTSRGITAVAALCDEVAFWRSDDAANPDTEILNALRPSLATTGGPLIVISSPYARRGELYTTWKRDFGPDGDPLVLVAHGTSRDLNPSLPQRVVDRALERDPAAAAAEFMAVFRVDVEAFVTREVIDACTVAGRYELAPLPNTRYVAFVDPSGGSADSFTLTIAHREGETAVIDAIREVRPPFSPDSVVEEFATLVKSYNGLRTVVGDRYGGDWPASRFSAHGVTYEPSEKTASDLYLEALPLLNAGRVELLDLPRLASQLVGLERRTSRTGRDTVTHAPNAHDDVSNSAMGAAVLAATRAGVMPLSDEFMARCRVPGRYARPQTRYSGPRLIA